MKDIALLLDMDGVLVHTQALQFKAWKQVFNKFFGKDVFDISDYYRFIDGKTRPEAAKAYLAYKGVELKVGEESDGMKDKSLWGLCNQKKEIYLSQLPVSGGLLYHDTIRFLSQWTRKHIPLAVISSSDSADLILKSSGIDIYFDAIVTALLAKKLKLKSRPDPDYFLHAAQLLGFRPEECIIVDDSIAGIQATAQIKQEFGLKASVGIIRSREVYKEHAVVTSHHVQLHEKAMYAAGADYIFYDLGQLNQLLFEERSAA